MEIRSIFKATVLAACCLSSLMFVSCKRDRSAEMKFNPAAVEVSVGKTATVAINNGKQPFTVKSSDEKTATAKVERNIMTVTGVKEGKAVITVTDKNKHTGSVAISVKATPVLSFDKTTVAVEVGKEAVVTIKSGKAPYTVTVKDAAVATAAEKDGKITVKGVKAGSTTVEVVDKNKVAGSFEVTVK